MARYIFITGTDTGVGKTVLAAALTRWLRASGRPAVALKPLASGDRSDARKLEAAQDGALAIDWINPWSFTEPLTPLLAARRDGCRVDAAMLLKHVKATSKKGDPVVVEGAGGLLSPLVVGADAPQLIVALQARTVIVARDRLGVINQVRLVWHALPASARRHAQVVLMPESRGDHSTPMNQALLGEYLGSERIHLCPRWSRREMGRTPEGESAGMLARLAGGLGV